MEAGRQLSEYGLGYDVDMKLVQNYLNQGYHLFIDNFYTSVRLTKHLFQHGVQITTGTIWSTRKDFPANLKNGKQWVKGKERGNMGWERDSPALQWVDNKVVSMISEAANVNDTVQDNRWCLEQK